ncbi:MAG: hypothetical protein LBB84_00195 [Tannerellaceae bacterium]|jgi:hypothetical protein|nr:hypothetical protein [Tannerellaceae bacterium]
MKNFYVFVVLGLFLFSVGCSDDTKDLNWGFSTDESVLPIKTDIKLIDSLVRESFVLQVTYKDKKFTVPCELVNDSIVYLDKTFEKWYQVISQLPNLQTLYKGENEIELFETKQDLFAKLEYKIIKSSLPFESVQTKAGTGLIGTVTLYDDVNYKDRSISYFASINQYSEDNYLDDEGSGYFNDKTSSLKVFYTDSDTNYCAIFTGYENSYYGGRTLVITSTGTTNVPNLKNIPCGSGNWNDRISSLTFQIAER